MTLECDQFKNAIKNRRRSPSEFTWNDEATEFAKQCHADGLSATEAAARINDKFGGHLTRDAVCGRWWRMGLKGVANLANRQVAAVRAKRRADEHRETKKAQRAAKRIALGIPPPALNHDEALTATTLEAALVPAKKHRKQLHELNNATCRWPYGEPGTPDFFFCGKDGANLELGRRYCPYHMEMACAHAPKYSKGYTNLLSMMGR